MKTLALLAMVAVLAPSIGFGEESAGGASGRPGLAREILDTLLKIQGEKPGFRPVHAKGIVCEGTFEASKEASGLSRAGHFRAPSVPVTLRFSDGAADPMIPDNSPNAGPRGLAIRFKTPGGGDTDIVAMSHNGFVVANGEEFLALQKSVAATDPSQPHPWPVEQFLGSHPLALKFVKENAVVPESFGTESFFSNDSFVLVNKEGARQVVRYQIVPVAGTKHLSEEESKGKSANYLIDDLKATLGKSPIKYRLVAQLPNAGDVTSDPSLVWPDDRKTVELGVITVLSVVADSSAAEKELAFDPTSLTDGIELSDDLLPTLRSKVYAMSVKHRQKD